MELEHYLLACGPQAARLSLTGLRLGGTFFQALFLKH